MAASSSDEGEIVEDGVSDLKATTQPRTKTDRNSQIDRIDRPMYDAPAAATAARRHGHRHQSPDSSYRRSQSPRGLKRPREDREHYRRDDRDHRASYRPSSRYDERRDYRRSRITYDDLGGPPSPRRPDASYDRREPEGAYDRDQGSRGSGQRRDDQYTTTSQSQRRDATPPRHSRRDVRRVRFVEENTNGRNATSSRKLDYDGASSRETVSGRKSDRDTQSRTGHKQSAYLEASGNNGPNSSSAQTNGRPPVQAALAQADFTDFEEPEVIDEEAEIARRKKRREEILAKSSPATPLLLHAVGAGEKVRAMSPVVSQPSTPQSPARSDALDSGESASPAWRHSPTDQSAMTSPRSPASQEDPMPGIDLMNDLNLMNEHASRKADADDGPSAADYDPTMDMKEDERRDELRHGQVVLHGEPHAIETTEPVETKASPTKVASGKHSSDDNSEDDGFDMFAEEFDEDKYATRPTDLDNAKTAEGPSANEKGGLLEGDDKDGYYKIRVGEVLDGRYRIQAALGRGMFSGVARAQDTTTQQIVAIKIMRRNDALRKGGFTEIAILQKLNVADPENRRHIVKFERQFEFRGHLCMAFENLSMNLREVLRKFGNNVGINLSACRTYAQQIFVALAHMRKCDIIHADLKPDNILVSENRATLKICDLGTAIDRSDAATAHTEITPYLVSRFYRAPEIILGAPYDQAVDMWSIGCTLYELYTGKILFTGDSNNQMLRAIQEVRGKLTLKLAKRGQLSGAHFDDMGQFVSIERDKVLNKTAVRKLTLVKPTRDLRARLLAASSGLNESEMRDLNLFVDLLEHCLALNPDKRIRPSEALKHPFFSTSSSSSTANGGVSSSAAVSRR